MYGLRDRVRPAGLERQLRELGWDITAHPTAGPFYWGSGHHNRPF